MTRGAVRIVILSCFDIIYFFVLLNFLQLPMVCAAVVFPRPAGKRIRTAELSSSDDDDDDERADEPEEELFESEEE